MSSTELQVIALRQVALRDCGREDMFEQMGAYKDLVMKHRGGLIHLTIHAPQSYAGETYLSVMTFTGEQARDFMRVHPIVQSDL